MAAMAQGWDAQRIRLDNDLPRKSRLSRTAVTKISAVVHNPGLGLLALNSLQLFTMNNS
jgi:hypothetical protein